MANIEGAGYQALLKQFASERLYEEKNVRNKSLVLLSRKGRHGSCYTETVQ